MQIRRKNNVGRIVSARGKATPSVQSLASWAAFREEFKSLEGEESKISWEKKKNCESFVQFDNSMSGPSSWTLRGGPDQDFRERCIALSRRAGVAAGASPAGNKGRDATIRWFKALYSYLKLNRSQNLKTYNPDRGGFILLFCNSSATLCSHLESKTTLPPVQGVSSLPAAWEDLSKKQSIPLKLAAEYLDCSAKTIYRRVKANKLKLTGNKRVICNELLRHEIRQVHGPQVLR